MRLRRSPPEYLARPGVPTRYSLDAARRLLGVHSRTVLKYIESGEITARRRGGRWWIPRTAVCHLARVLYGDRPLKLARILSVKPRMIALVDDMAIRRHLGPFHPIYCSSPFGLGQRLCIQPASIVVVDWDYAGSEWAIDIAERLNLLPDRPRLVAILPEHRDKAGRGWDVVIRRPCGRADVLKALATKP